MIFRLVMTLSSKSPRLIVIIPLNSKLFPLQLFEFLVIILQIETLIHQFHFIKNDLKNSHHTHINSFKDQKEIFYFLSVSLTYTHSLKEQFASFPALKRTFEIQAANLPSPIFFLIYAVYPTSEALRPSVRCA